MIYIREAFGLSGVEIKRETRCRSYEVYIEGPRDGHLNVDSRLHKIIHDIEV